MRIVQPLNLAGRVLTRQVRQAFLHEFPHHRIALIRGALRHRDAEMHAQARISDDYVVKDVVRVTHPRNLLPGEALER